MKHTAEEMVTLMRMAKYEDALELLKLYAESFRQEGEKQGLEFAVKLTRETE